MKLFIVLAAVALAQAGRLDRVYLPPNARASAGSNFLQTPNHFNGLHDNLNDYSNGPTQAYAKNGYSGYDSRPERAQAALERNAAILRQDSSNDGETYSYAYETENGIYAEESGVATNGVQAQGGYSYTGDDGKFYSISYTADENGFVPQGDHLPTPPPIPEEILRSLEQNARDEAAGIYDDGSYNEGKHSGHGQQYYNTNAQPINNNDDSVITSALRNTGHGNFPQKTYLPPQSALRYTPGHGNNLPQKTYLPPQSNYNDDSVVTSALRNSGGHSGNLPQKTYLPPHSQSINYNDDSVITSAFRHGSNGLPQKTYLPPTRRTHQRYNNRDGYRY